MLHECNEHKRKEIRTFILGKYSLGNLSNWEGEDPFIARLFTIEIIIGIKLITNVNQSSKASHIVCHMKEMQSLIYLQHKNQQ